MRVLGANTLFRDSVAPVAEGAIAAAAEEERLGRRLRRGRDDRPAPRAERIRSAPIDLQALAPHTARRR